MQFARSPIAASLALILAAIAPCSAATPIPPALAEAIEVIRASALDADRLDWDALGAEIVSRLGEDATAEAYRPGRAQGVRRSPRVVPVGRADARVADRAAC
jgi:hypothetical protein